MRTAMIYLEIECEVPYRESIDAQYGADADGNRGIRLVELEQDGAVIIHTADLPEAVREWAKAEAVKQWEETR